MRSSMLVVRDLQVKASIQGDIGSMRAEVREEDQSTQFPKVPVTHNQTIEPPCTRKI
jgi:hypothetical protein